MPLDLASVRLDNALVLFEEFVAAAVKHPDAATLRGLEGRFAERLGIQPSYWSQIKSRSRQIGERLARQFEQQCHKPRGWMDVPSAQRAGSAPHPAGTHAAPASAPAIAADTSLPQSDEERFIVGLVLTYYRRHPQRARERLLDILGEVLVPDAVSAPQTPAPTTTHTTRTTTAASPTAASAAKGARAAPATSRAIDDELWARTRAGVAPLKRKR